MLVTVVTVMLDMLDTLYTPVKLAMLMLTKLATSPDTFKLLKPDHFLHPPVDCHLDKTFAPNVTD